MFTVSDGFMGTLRTVPRDTYTTSPFSQTSCVFFPNFSSSCDAEPTKHTHHPATMKQEAQKPHENSITNRMPNTNLTTAAAAVAWATWTMPHAAQKSLIHLPIRMAR